MKAENTEEEAVPEFQGHLSSVKPLLKLAQLGELERRSGGDGRAVLRISESGWRVFFHTQRVMFCRAYLRKEVFQEYEYQWHEPVDLGISLRSLLSAASILSDNSQLDVRLDWRQCNLTMFLEKQALTPDDRPGGCQAVVQLSLLELDDVVAPGELAEIHQDMKLVNAANAADTERWLFNKSRTLVDLTARADLVKDHLAEIEQPNAKSVTLDIDSRQIKFHVTADGSQWTLIMPRDFADLFSTYQIHESVKVRYNVNILGAIMKSLNDALQVTLQVNKDGMLQVSLLFKLSQKHVPADRQVLQQVWVDYLLLPLEEDAVSSQITQSTVGSIDDLSFF